MENNLNELEGYHNQIKVAKSRLQLTTSALMFERIYLENFGDVPDSGNWKEELSKKINQAKKVREKDLKSIQQDLVDATRQLLTMAVLNCE